MDGRGCNESSLFAHAGLAGMQNSLKQEGQLLQRDVHHFPCQGKNPNELAHSQGYGLSATLFHTKPTSIN